MGYGEVGGGGSVKWQVRYDVSEPNTDPNPHAPNKPLQGHGKDRGAQTDIGDKLYVICTNARLVSNVGGTVTVEVTLANNREQVVLKWGDDVGSLSTVS